MPRKKKRERGTKGEPWYRKFNDTWYVDYNDKQLPIKDENGHNVKGADSKPTAKQCWVMMQARMLAPEKADDNHVRMVFGLYLDHVKQNHPDAHPAYRRTLVGFADSLSSREYLIKDLTAFNVDEWLRPHEEWSNTTKASYIAIVMAALNWAAEPHRRLISANPIRGYKKPRRRSRGSESLVTKETHATFLDHVPDDFAVILRVLRDTGTRPSNVCRVTAAHCDWEDGGWWFTDTNAVNGKVHKTFDKTGEGLFVPVSEAVMNVCRELAQKYPEGPLFRTKEGEAWNSDKIAQRFGYYKSKLVRFGVPMPGNYFAYCYRHTRLTEMLEDGNSPSDVAAVAGHKGTATLHQHYDHVLDNRKRTTNTLRKHLTDRDRSPQSAEGEGEAASSSAG